MVRHIFLYKVAPSADPNEIVRILNELPVKVPGIRTWTVGTDEGNWTSMAVPSDGSYGVDEGLISSFPCTCANGEYSIVQGLEIDDFSRARIDASVAELREERDAVAELGLM